MDYLYRMRRNRRSQAIRDLVSETELSVKNLVYPLFICEGEGQTIPIPSMPGCFRLSIDKALEEIKTAKNLGIRSFALFPAIDEKFKNTKASEALNDQGLVPRALTQIKKQFADVALFSDIALDPFSSDGHDGLVENGEILNDESVEVLSQMAVVHAKAGADYVCPSDMMDGRVLAMREALDESGYANVGILAYAAKYCSSFYGPFRDALESAPKAGDKKTYQMDFRNSLEALRETELDIQEGADIVMVKPALSYLDIIGRIKDSTTVPVAAYNVSGEYAMIKFAAKAGVLDEDKAIIETLTAMRRAGASIIFTYFAKRAAELILAQKQISNQ